ncbi:hypothetical protein AFLA_006254 [Aspergillus flavus NRRL3357]|nr:hypothetical protein AFLA_006254 [Aspergillus flavus NRRL3357]
MEYGLLMIAHLASEVDRGDILNARSRDRYTKMQGAELRNTIWHFPTAVPTTQHEEKDDADPTGGNQFPNTALVAHICHIAAVGFLKYAFTR